MLLIKSNGFLEGLVTDCIAMGEIFCKNARAGFIFLLDVVVVLVFGLGG